MRGVLATGAGRLRATVAADHHRGPLPGACRRGRALRELLPQGLPPGRAARRLDPLHGAQAPGRAAERLALVHAVRREPPAVRARTRTTLPGPERRRAATGSGWGEASDRRRARRSAGRDGAEWDLRLRVVRAAALPPPARAGCTARRCPARSCSARPGGPLRRHAATWTAAASRSTAGAAMIGHNWGAQHAERWIWLHALTGGRRLARRRARARSSSGRLTTPWVASGALSLDGERHALGGLGRKRRGARGARTAATSSWPAGDCACAGACRRAAQGRASAGSTRIRPAPSTTPSTARSPT